MNKNKIKKYVVYYVAFFICLTLIWNLVLHFFIIPSYFVKTRATVISLSTENPITYRGGRQKTTFPTYSYTDDRGIERTFTSRDGFNRINGVLFKKEVGKTYAAYYEKGSKEGLFVTGTGDWLTFLLAPLVFALFPFALIFAFIMLKRRRQQKL